MISFFILLFAISLSVVVVARRHVLRMVGNRVGAVVRWPQSSGRGSSVAVGSLMAVAVVAGLSGCGGSTSNADTARVMPSVVGKQLDLALSEIKSAGFSGKVDVSGGGTFGVVNESNWQVCSQSPDAGQPIEGTPKVSVDRTCGGSSSESASGSSSTSTSAPAPVPLTAATSAEFAAVLADGSGCSDSVQQFASKYAGQSIEFDGNVADVSQYGDTKTRYDFLISPGDFSTTSAIGPIFKIENANTVDLHLTGPNIPAYIEAGNNIHIVAKVVEFNKVQCLFFIKPVSISMR